jgi:predicted transcriptional regulator
VLGWNYLKLLKRRQGIVLEKIDENLNYLRSTISTSGESLNLLLLPIVDLVALCLHHQQNWI